MSGKEEINRVFHQMLEVQGLLGVGVFSPYGDFSYSQMTSALQGIDVKGTCAIIREMIESVTDFGTFPDDIVYTFKRYAMVVKDLESGFLLLIHEPSANMSTIKIGIEFALNKLPFLISDLEIQALQSGNDEADNHSISTSAPKLPADNKKSLKHETILIGKGAKEAGNTIIKMKPDVAKRVKILPPVESDSKPSVPSKKEQNPQEDDGFILF